MLEFVDSRMETDRKECLEADVNTDIVEINDFSAQVEIPSTEWIKSIKQVEV